ncbi:MAG: M56 family metallopeptidase [Huintestinicola sp.]
MPSVIITSTLLGIAAIIIRKAFGGRTGIKPFIIMWAVVFLKFAVPAVLPSHFSMMNLFPQNTSAAENSAPISYDTAEDTDGYAADIPEISPPVYDMTFSENIIQPSYEEVKHWDIESIAETIYLAVAAMLIFSVLFAIIICTIKFSRLPVLENDTCKGIIADSGIKRRITVRSGDIDTPAVFGVLFPVIILPESIDKSNDKLLRHIMLHEISHIKHLDPLWNILTLIICAVNWYNPIVWICRYMYLADTEKLCDMSVVKMIGSENRKEYANSLLECAASKRHPVMLVSGFGESGIKSRIKNIMSMKKVRIITIIAAVFAIIIAAVIFGTGRKIEVKTRDVEAPQNTSLNNTYSFSQIIEDSEGEAGQLLVSINKGNAYYVDISFESEKYTLSSINSLTVLSDVSSYRIYVGDEEKGDFTSADGFVAKEYFDDATYEKVLDINDPHYMIEAYFVPFNGRANIEINLEYKLKKGIFDAGSHYFTCSVDPFDMSNISASDNFQYELMNNSAGYNAQYNEETGEYELRSEKSDIVLALSEDYNGFYAWHDADGSYSRKHYSKNISPENGTSDVSEIFLSDIDSDGTDDIMIITYYREDEIMIINGADLSEIAVDNDSVREMLNISVTQLSDTEFNVSCAGEEHVFTLYSPVDTELALDENGNIKIAKTVKYSFDEGKIYNNCELYLLTNSGYYYSYLTYVRMVLEYTDGKLIPISAQMDTSDDIYYIKDEPAAKAEQALWSYEFGGYNVPYLAELVRAENKYRLRVINKLTDAYCGSYEMPIEQLPENIDDYFRFTGLDRSDPGIIIYAEPDNGAVFDDELYLATFYKINANGKPQRKDIIDASGRKMRNIHISDNFTSEWSGFMSDTYQSSEGKVNLRLVQRDNAIYIIDMISGAESYRAIDSIDVKMAMRESDNARTVFYNGNGEITETYPLVNGRVYDVSNIFKSIRSDLTHCSYLGNECDVSSTAYSQTEINAGGEKYIFRIYDSDILEFSYKDISEFYKLDDADMFRSNHLSITMDYMDYIAKCFTEELSSDDRSMARLSAMLDENIEVGSPWDWKIFQNVSIISDANYVSTGDADGGKKYKVSFFVNSLEPAPFKNGENVYEIVVSEDENGETKITSISEV